MDLTKFVNMTEQEKQEECSKYANARLCSFKYLKKTENYYDGYFNIAYLLEGNIVASISFHFEDIEDENILCTIGVYYKKECILLDWGTIKMLNTYLKNATNRFA